MLSNILLPIGLFLASFTTASPVAETGVAKRDTPVNGTVVMCSGFNWSGACQTLSVSLEYGSCNTLKKPWLFNISSFEPVYGTVCYLQKSTNCQDLCMSPAGCNTIVEFPGYANLSTYGLPTWTKQVGSFTCGPSDHVGPSPNPYD